MTAAAAARSVVTVPRDAALWRYELSGKRLDSAARREIRILEHGGARVGYLAHVPELWDGSVVVTAFEVAADVSWSEAWIPAVRYLFEAGETAARAAPRCLHRRQLLAARHRAPVYRVFRFRERDDGYAWYARVPDVAGFLQTVGPALERRLAASPCAGHTGALTLGFYTGGVRLTLERGKVASVTAWRPEITPDGIEFGRPSSDPRRPLAMFPDLTFLQLLLGFRSLRELESAFPDCIVRTNEARALLDALFPKGPSDVWPVL